MSINEKLLAMQSELKAPKNQFNNFGKYNYRSCEDILEAVKPLGVKYKVVTTLRDDVVLIGDRYYLKAIATATDAETGEKIEVSAYAREDETKKGMDLAQVTGSVSSYARKYALNGLYCIDDTKDSDATNKHGKEDKPTGNNNKPNNNQPTSKPVTNTDLISESQQKRLFALAKGNVNIVKTVVSEHKYSHTNDIKKSDYDSICKEIENKAKANGWFKKRVCEVCEWMYWTRW